MKISREVDSVSIGKGFPLEGGLFVAGTRGYVVQLCGITADREEYPIAESDIGLVAIGGSMNGQCLVIDLGDFNPNAERLFGKVAKKFTNGKQFFNNAADALDAIGKALKLKHRK